MCRYAVRSATGAAIAPATAAGASDGAAGDDRARWWWRRAASPTAEGCAWTESPYHISDPASQPDRASSTGQCRSLVVSVSIAVLRRDCDEPECSGCVTFGSRLAATLCTHCVAQSFLCACRRQRADQGRHQQALQQRLRPGQYLCRGGRPSTAGRAARPLQRPLERPRPGAPGCLDPAPHHVKHCLQDVVVHEHVCILSKISAIATPWVAADISRL